jgi:hypothetical protein
MADTTIEFISHETKGNDVIVFFRESRTYRGESPVDRTLHKTLKNFSSKSFEEIHRAAKDLMREHIEREDD